MLVERYDDDNDNPTLLSFGQFQDGLNEVIKE